MDWCVLHCAAFMGWEAFSLYDWGCMRYGSKDVFMNWTRKLLFGIGSVTLVWFSTLAFLSCCSFFLGGLQI